jgi:hypothetical protein
VTGSVGRTRSSSRLSSRLNCKQSVGWGWALADCVVCPILEYNVWLIERDPVLEAPNSCACRALGCMHMACFTWCVHVNEWLICQLADACHHNGKD